MEKLQYISQASDTCSHIEGIEKVCKAGVKWVQLRIKETPEDDILPVALEARKLTSHYGAKLIINDFPNIALKVGADGVHVGKEDTPVAAVRKIVGDKFIIGGSANTYEDILLHYTHGANYVGVGPFNFTTTKKKLSPVLGLSGYKQLVNKCISNKINIPLIGIGGITLNDIAAITECGIYGIAVSSLLFNTSNIQEDISKIQIQLQNTITHV